MTLGPRTGTQYDNYCGAKRRYNRGEMITPLIRPLGALVEADPAYNTQSEESFATSAGPGNNGVFQVGGALYQILLQPDFVTFQPFRSIDGGSTYQQFGTSIDLSGIGSEAPICTFQFGNQIAAAYTIANLVPAFSTVVVQFYDPIADVWGAQSFWANDGAVADATDGVMQALARPDGSYLLVFGGQDQVGAIDACFYISFDPILQTFGNGTLLSSTVGGEYMRYFEAGFVEAAGASQIILATADETTQFVMQQVNADDSLGPVQVLPAGFVTAGQSGVIGYGLLNGATQYAMPCGGSDGTLRLLYFDAGWQISAQLDPLGGQIFASPILTTWRGWIVCVYQSEANGLLRFGWVAPENVANPGKWQWGTGYNLSAPEPPVDGVTAPYGFQGATGPGQQLVNGQADGVLRFSMFVWNAGAAPFDLPGAAAAMFQVSPASIKITLRGSKRRMEGGTSSEPRYVDVPQGPDVPVDETL